MPLVNFGRRTIFPAIQFLIRQSVSLKGDNDMNRSGDIARSGGVKCLPYQVKSEMEREGQFLLPCQYVLTMKM